MFNSIIQYWDLRDLDSTGSCFTWSFNHKDPLLKNLDRFLVSIDWEMHLPLAFVKTLPRLGFHLVPLVIDFGFNKPKVIRPFKFKLCWFLIPDLQELVRTILEVKVF